MLQPATLVDLFPSASTHPIIMSTDCESVPPQPHTTKSLVSAPSINNPTLSSEHHPTSGISYEGRVSVIPPLAGYEATMRAAMELDRTHSQNQQIAMDTARVHNEQHFDALQMQEFRRMYEQRARMHEASQMFAHREEFRQPYAPPQEPYTSKEVPKNPSPIPESSAHSLTDNCNSLVNHENVPPDLLTNVQIKEEPKQQVDEQSPSTGNLDCGSENPSQYESESVLRFARSEHQVEPIRSPIDKAGESPDLPTDSARIQPNSEAEQQDSFHEHESSKHAENMERMSPYEESYHGSDDRMPSSIEPDICDPMDASGMPSDVDMDPLSQLQHALELSSVMSGKNDEGGDKPQVFQCHICSYSGTSRFHFNAHLNTHYDHKCAKCEFVSHTEPKLREHMQDEHGLSPDSNEDLEAIRVPRVNAQGKVKTFKCKQCDYVAITKGDFWAHARSHIKSEKLLTCPKCPFVTEYKHHLEYHLRNHFGSKPFKCNKCNYSCVNKSMLNSHMKSHSNIYQYRCADCNYATKYCHSLKLHLRKYNHNPAMVLNPDGSPNPIPIIDVYGTRRGPKLKKDDKGMPILPPHYQMQAELLKAQIQMQGSISTAPTSPQDASNLPPPPSQNRQSIPNPPTTPNGPPHSPFSYPYPSMVGNLQSSSPILSRALEKSPEETRNFEGREQLRELLLERERLTQKLPLSPGGILKCSLCEFSTDHREIYSQHMMLHAASESRDIGDIEEISHSPQNIKRPRTPERHPLAPSRLPLFPHQLPQTISSDTGHPYSPLAAAHNLKEYLARAMNPFLYPQMMGSPIHPAFGLQQLNRLTQTAFQIPPLTKTEEESSQISPQHTIIQTHSPGNDGVLDLSKEQTPPQQIAETSKEPPPPRTKAEARASISPHHSSPQSSSPPRSEASTPPSKNRRKGRAFKLERIAMRLSESAEGESSGHDEDIRRDENTRRGLSESRIPPLMPLDDFDAQGDIREEWQAAHHCQFCDMAFKDVIMYTMHMGYHGYQNPFTCNMCGHQSTDKVAFFLHIARSSHS